MTPAAGVPRQEFVPMNRSFVAEQNAELVTILIPA